MSAIATIFILVVSCLVLVIASNFSGYAKWKLAKHLDEQQKEQTRESD